MKHFYEQLAHCSPEQRYKNKDCIIDISVIEVKDQYIITIKDNGKGVKEGSFPNIFKKGTSLNKPGGQGLGLYHAKKIIELEKGNISFQSQKAVGTTIKVSLPKHTNTFLYHGEKPFKNVMIEDYALSQFIWHEEAIDKDLSFAVFSSPADFLNNINSVDKNANIYIDSHFPDFHEKGEDWSKDLGKKGFSNIYICSTNNINIDNKPWIKGQALKNKPFTTR